MLNFNLYDKGIIDFYLGSPVKGEREYPARGSLL